MKKTQFYGRNILNKKVVSWNVLQNVCTLCIFQQWWHRK